MVRLTKIVTCIAGFAAASSALCASPYVSVKGYSYEPPLGWTLAKTSPTIDSMFTAPSTSIVPPSISVAILRFADGATTDSGIKNMHDTVLKSESVIPNFTLIDDSPTKVGKSEAYSVTATFRGDPKIPLIKVHQIFTGHGRIGYVVTATALATDYDSVSAALDKTLASFAFSVGTGEPVVSIDGYAVTPPRDWAVQLDTGSYGSFFVDVASKEFMTHIGIKAQAQDVPVTAADLFGIRDKIADSVTQGMTDVKVLDRQMTSVGGSDAVAIEASFAAPNVANRLWIRQIYIPHGKKLIQISMMGEESQRDDFLPILDSMLKTFTWTSTPSVAPAATAPAAK